MNSIHATKAKEALASAREFAKNEQYAEALETLKGMPHPSIPQNTPLFYQLLVVKGVASLKTGKLKKSERVLSKATKARPELPLAWKSMFDLYQLACHNATTMASSNSRSGTTSSQEILEKSVEKMVQVLKQLIPLLLNKGKTKRALELSDALSMNYAKLGQLDEAVGVLQNSQLYDIHLIWPRLELFYQQMERDDQLESLYRQVHHLPGLVNLYWRLGRLAELIETANQLIHSGSIHWSGLETFLILDASDDGLVSLTREQRDAYARKLAFTWPDRPLSWSYLLPDEEVDAIQNLLLNCPAAISQWLRIARLRLKAQQPRYCLSAIRHGVKSILRMTQEAFSKSHPLSCNLIDWSELPTTAHMEEQISQLRSVISFH